MRSISRTFAGLGVLLGVVGACDRFTHAAFESEAQGGAGGEASTTTGSAGAGPSSTATGAPCGEAMPCGTCAICDAGVCAAEPAGATCADGVCDGAAHCAVGGVAWVRTFGIEGQNAIGQDVDVDPSGQVLFTGYYLGSTGKSLAFDEHEVGSASVSGDANIFVVAVDAQAGAVTWADDIGSGADTGQFTETLVADRSRGGAWLGGHYAGAFTFGAWSPMSSNGGNDLLVARVSSAGVGEQAFTHNDLGVQEVWALSTDTSGRVVGAGMNRGTIAAGAHSHTSANGQEAAFALLVDATAEPLWVAGIEHSNSDTSQAHGVAIHADTVWMAGSYRGTTATLPASGDSNNAFVARLAVADGSFTSLMGWGTPTGSQTIGALAATSDGVVAVGCHTEAFELDGRPVPDTGVFIAWFDDVGASTRVVSYTATGTPMVHDAAVDGMGNIIIVGSINAGSITFGNHEIESTGQAAFVAKLAHDGVALWAHTSSGDSDGARGVAWHDGAIYVAGYTNLGAFGSTEPIIGAHDIFVARLDP